MQFQNYSDSCARGLNEKTGRPISPGMKLLLHRIDKNYCLQTRILTWDCNVSKNYIKQAPRCLMKVFQQDAVSVS